MCVGLVVASLFAVSFFVLVPFVNQPHPPTPPHQLCNAHTLTFSNYSIPITGTSNLLSGPSHCADLGSFSMIMFL